MSEKDFLQWKVKPLWKIRFPSSKIGNESGSFTIYGVDRGSLDISRNWAKIHSVEQFNQGFVEQPTDFTVTIAVKEHGDAFEKLRRLAMGVMFDVECDVYRIDATAIGDLETEYSGSIDVSDYVPWMKGFEKFIGCVVNREGQTIDIGAFPVREFEIIFLEHDIKKHDDFNSSGALKEGDGSYPTLSDLGLT